MREGREGVIGGLDRERGERIKRLRVNEECTKMMKAVRETFV